MRVLFLEQDEVWMDGLPNGFRDIGLDVLVTGKLRETTLPEIIDDFRPDFIMTIARGKKGKEEWIRRYVKVSGIPHIYWATEDPIHTSTYSLPLIQKIQPDFVFTVCSSMVDFYQNNGFPSAYLDFGYHPSIHYFKRENSYNCSVAVVANAYPDVLKKHPEIYRHQSLKILISPLIKEGVPIHFWGRHWDTMKPFLEKDIPPEWLHGHVPYRDAHKVYSSSKIILGLQNHTTQLTQRTYEILGSGGFLLTVDTPEVNRLFTTGKELVTSSSAEETLSLVHYYLEHVDKREQIQKQGQLAVKKHSYKHRAEYIIEVLKDRRIL